MFLLILARTLKTGQSNPNFTFHNVSINTVNRGCAEYVEHIFTFHNVSINTRAPHSPIIHRLFYHFLSTLSFTIILYTKIDIITLYKTSICLINKGFVNLLGFFPYHRLTITE